MTTVRLQLDASALEALFPPGSEVRADLTRAVTASLVSKLAVKDFRFLDDDLRMKVRAEVHNEVRQIGGWGAATEDSRFGIQLTEKFKIRLKDEVRSQVDDFISEETTNKLSQAAGDIEARIQRAIESRFEPNNRERLKSLIREVVRESITIN